MQATDDPAPSYRSIMETRLLQVPDSESQRGWSGYLLARDEPPPQEPVSLQDAFEDYRGTYLLALTAPQFADAGAVEKFIGKVRDYLDQSFGNGGRFNGRAVVWIADVNTPAFGDADHAAVSFSQQISGWSTSSNLNVLLGAQASLGVPDGLLIGRAENGLRVSGIGVGPKLFFSTSPDPDQGPSIDPNKAVIPLYGPYSGCVLMQGEINARKSFPFFKTGLRFAHANDDGTSSCQWFPVFDTAAAAKWPYIGAVDPLDPRNRDPNTTDPDAGRLRTLIAPVQKGGEPARLPSYWRSNENHALDLVSLTSAEADQGPPDGAPALVFERRDAGGEPNPPVYWTLAGDWALAGGEKTGDGGAPATVFLPGLFGTEAMTYRPFTGEGEFDLLRFIPGRPGYAPVFPFARANLNEPDSGRVGERLTDASRTAWATLVAGAGGRVQYRALPEGGALYAGGGEPYAPGSVLPDEPGFAVPMAPYAGLPVDAADSFDAGVLNLYESQILSPQRKSVIADALRTRVDAMKQVRRGAREEAATVTSTTAQGLLARVAEGEAGADYTKVTLGVCDPPAGRAPEMAFLDLETPLQNLFQSNQLFSVIVNPRYLGALQHGRKTTASSTPGFENSLTISGWTMTANIGARTLLTDYRNVMIFKYCDGNLRDRVRNPNKWVSTADFSVVDGAGDDALALTGLSQWLQNFIEAAIEEAEVRDNDLYKNFARIVQSDTWQGVLVLRAQVDPEGFPDQLRGLTAGIDFSQFEAHHFGITVSRVTPDGDGYKIDGISSSFGLIDYQLPLFKQNMASGGNPDTPLGLKIDGRYGFTVLQLQALFENAALTRFVSRVQLTVNELFGSRVIDTYNQTGPLAANGVVLVGSYQQQGDSGEGIYVFEQDRKVIFRPDSNALNAIAFNRVQFNSLSADSGGDNPRILSRFLIWGEFDFETLDDTGGEAFDVLSFGTGGDRPFNERGDGLAFSNLQINLSSPVSTPNDITFAFNADGLAFDLDASRVRPSSLFPGFALQVDSFIAAPADKRPVDYGFLPVQTPLSLQALDGAWYGVVYKITMGTPGALVSGAGFESRLLLAWSPQTAAGESRTAAFAGIQLPGTAPGAKLLSIQGVLKVSIDRIQLLHDAVQGGEEKTFTLRLGNIGLKFLGIAKLPPGATINFFLFGDPGQSGSLGWYAAYNKDQASQPLPAPAGRKRA